jgi:hypothetical protein
MFRFGMFVACSGFVAMMIYTAFSYQIEKDLALEYAPPVVSSVPDPSFGFVEPMDMIDSSDEPVVEVDKDKAKASVAKIRRQPKMKMEVIDIDKSTLLAVDKDQAAASAKAFTAFGPEGQKLEVFAYDQQWQAYAAGMGQEIATKKGHTARFFRIRPNGYTPAVQLGATRYAGRYTLKSDKGQAFTGAIVGYVGRTDVVCFFVPNEQVVELGQIQVVDPTVKVTVGQQAE